MDKNQLRRKAWRRRQCSGVGSKSILGRVKTGTFRERADGQGVDRKMAGKGVNGGYSS